MPAKRKSSKPASKTKKLTTEQLDKICCEVDRLFDLYGKPTDNCIVLGVYYDDEERRETAWQSGHTFVCESPVALSAAGDFRYFSDCYDWDYYHNPYVRPVMHDISAFTMIREDGYCGEDDGFVRLKNGMSVGPIEEDAVQEKDTDKIPDRQQVEQLRDYYDDAERLFKKVIPYLRMLRKNPADLCDEWTNCYWRNYLVIGRDYKLRSFSMRYDAMMQDISLTFDDMVDDTTLADIGHTRKHYRPSKKYGPTTNVRVREPVPFIDWPDYRKHMKDYKTIDNVKNIPFAKMKLKELPISMITDMFLNTYQRGRDQELTNMFHYHPLNTDEKIYDICQNSVYSYEYGGDRYQVAFNWYTLCCLHGDTNTRKAKSTRVVPTYIGDMTPEKFIAFIKDTFYWGDKEYTGDTNLLYYGLRTRKGKPWSDYDYEFGPDQDGTQYCFSDHTYSDIKPWYLSTDQFDRLYDEDDEDDEAGE